MGGTIAFLYHDDFLKYQFGPDHPFQPMREKMTLDTLHSLGMFDGDRSVTVAPEAVDIASLQEVHFSSYIDRVITASQRGELLDGGDTPALPGLFEGALRAVGATMDGARGIIRGDFDHAFNPAGGLHHAHPARASGFCVFNDIAVAVRTLQRYMGVGKIAVVDIDGHHGDGTQDIFYAEDVLTISLHQFGGGFFPGTGKADEIGELEGRGSNINIPLPRGTDDNLFLRAYRSIVVPALRSYQPEIIIQQFGADGHYRDPLVGMGYTTRGYVEAARLTHDLAHELCDGKYLVVGGGGYDLDATRRTWSLMYCAISEMPLPSGHNIRALHDHDAPLADQRTADAAQEVIEEVEGRSLPMLERAIRFA